MDIKSLAQTLAVVTCWRRILDHKWAEQAAMYAANEEARTGANPGAVASADQAMMAAKEFYNALGIDPDDPMAVEALLVGMELRETIDRASDVAQMATVVGKLAGKIYSVSVRQLDALNSEDVDDG